MSQQGKKSGRGCFFYGCLSVVVIFIIGILSLYFGTQYALKTLVNDYTSATPTPIPAVEMSDDQFATLYHQVTNFTSLVASGTNALSLSLTSDEINALIQKAPGNDPLKNKVHVRLEDDQIKGTVSLPLDDLDIARLKGRYLNGTAGFNLAVTNGLVFLTVKSLNINSKPLPESFMTGLRTENLAKEWNRNTNAIAEMKRFESVEVKGGKLIIKVLPAPPAVTNESVNPATEPPK